MSVGGLIFVACQRSVISVNKNNPSLNASINGCLLVWRKHMFKDCCFRGYAGSVRGGRSFIMKNLIVLVVTCLLAGACAVLAGVVRHPSVVSNMPVAVAVEVPPGQTIVYLSGTLPSRAELDASATQSATEIQTLSVLRSIEKKLNNLGLGMGDVVKMQVFLVGDPAKGGAMDYSGFMESYQQFFGSPGQVDLPSRTVVQVAGLPVSQSLVEIEVTAIRP